MSGVLDRMAQRALGTLPTVQPLMTPRYAGMREEPRGPEAGLEMTREIETIAPVRAREGDARRRPVAGSDGDVQRQEDKPKQSFEGLRPGKGSESPEKIAKAHEPVMPVSRPADISERQFPPMRRASQPGVERGRDIAAGHIEAELRPAQAGNRSETARTAKVVPRLERMEPRRENVKAEAMREKRETSGIGDALSPKDEPSRHEIVRNSDSPKSKRLVAVPPREIDRRGTPQGERQAAEPAEEKTEVHITIGSIELRAPRVEPRPQAAPFRPRVTLDEFLRRGQETRP